MDAEKTLVQLNELIESCQNTPFYQNRLTHGPLQSLEDFRRIPPTTKDDLRNHSLLGMIRVPPAQLFQYYESFDATDAPVPVWLTREDFQSDAEELSQWGVGFECHDIVMVRFPYSISGMAHIVTRAAQLRGACVVPAGARSKVSPFPRIVNLLRKLRVTILVCAPMQALLIAETAELMGFEPKKDFPEIRAICAAGETLSPGRRKTLECIWGVPVFNSYGRAETGVAVVDCLYQQSHPLEDSFYFEILRKNFNPCTEPGETGYLVISTLKRQAMPLIRYLTGDLARLIPVECPCGAKVSLEIRGQAESVVKLKGNTLDLWDIEELVSRLPYRRFWIAAPNGGQLDVIVEEEAGVSVTPEMLTSTCEYLEKTFDIKLSVTIIPKGSLYNREELLSVGEVGKPQYIYTPQEMAEQKYTKSARV